MPKSKPKVLAISGGISSSSYNKKILNTIKYNYANDCELLIYDQIANFPFFMSGISDAETPEIVKTFLKEVEKADG
ncbi:flavoprotein, partial [Leptospira meyeri]